MNIWHFSAVLLLFTGSASSQLPPWDNQLFEFQLTPSEPVITRCSNIAIGWSDRATATPASTPPYTITVLCDGYRPILIRTEPSHSYNWTVDLPVGDSYIMFMEDANRYSGGDSLAFSITDAGATCTGGSYVTSTLQLTSTGTYAECSTMFVTATGGSAPYTMQIIGASRPSKTTTWSTPQMFYTIDMKPDEHFFVLVTDANGFSGAKGYNVTSGDTGCYNQATTVLAGSLTTTLSYNPSSTFDPFGGESANVIQNTATTTLVTTVTAADGSRSAITLSPGASMTIIANTPTNGTSSPMPAIVGGVVGGAVLLFSLILFLWLRRRAARAKQVGMREIYDPHSMPIGASPYTPPPPGRDTAPLVGRMSSTNSTGSGHTAAPSTPGMSFFGGHNNQTTPGHEETQPWDDHNNLTTPGREEPPPWVIPVISPTDSNTYNRYSGGTPPLTESSSRPARSARSASVSSRPNGLPPGAMIPNPGGGMPEKARFVPASPSIVAPPSYTHGM